MTEGKRKFYRRVMLWEADGNSVAMIGGLLVLIALLLFFCISAVPAGATEVKPLTLLYFGCQDGYLKPCG